MVHFFFGGGGGSFIAFWETFSFRGEVPFNLIMGIKRHVQFNNNITVVNAIKQFKTSRTFYFCDFMT